MTDTQSPTARSEAAKAALRQQTIELPSRAFGNSGTRFKVFGTPGTPRDPYEKIADAAQVNAFTGAAPASRCTSRGTSSTTTRTCPGTPPSRA